MTILGAEQREIKVSVIIPVYNVEKYLRECLDSVVNQTLKDIEIICVDDGSTDSSLEILNEYAAKDSRIRVISQENLYAGVARNNGMKMAMGEYLYFMDSDDFCAPTMLEKLYLKGKQYDADIILCSYSLIIDAKIVDTTNKLENPVLHGVDIFNKYSLRDDLYQVVFTHPWDKLFKTKFVKDTRIKFQENKTNNDVFFSLMTVALADKIAYIPEKLYFYRKDSAGSLQKSKHTAPLSFIAAYEAVFEELNKRGIYHILEKTYVNVALNGIEYNFRTILDEDARMKVRENLVWHFFPRTHLLEYDKDYYIDSNKYAKICFIGAEYFEILASRKLGKTCTRTMELEQLRRNSRLLNDIKSGISFKIGRIITWIPRKLLGRK